jgi:hypothetical protein
VQLDAADLGEALRKFDGDVCCQAAERVCGAWRPVRRPSGGAGPSDDGAVPGDELMRISFPRLNVVTHEGWSCRPSFRARKCPGLLPGVPVSPDRVGTGPAWPGPATSRLLPPATGNAADVAGALLLSPDTGSRAAPDALLPSMRGSRRRLSAALRDLRKRRAASCETACRSSQGGVSGAERRRSLNGHWRSVAAAVIWGGVAARRKRDASSLRARLLASADPEVAPWSRSASTRTVFALLMRE